MKISVVIMQFLLVVQITTTSSVLGQLAGDTLTLNTTLVGRQTLISRERRFELGFFSPTYKLNKYLGIWFYNLTVPTVVWVANRATPINGSSGILSLSLDGNLVLSDRSKNIFWTTNTSNATNPVLRLLDSGNLVLSAGRFNTVLWQSFDYPCDTILSGMKIGVDFQARLVWKITSWKSSTDPSPGDYYYMSESHGVPETFIMRGSTRISRYYGPWDGDTFVDSNGVFEIEFVSNEHEVYYFVRVVSDSVRARVILNATGALQGFLWSETSNKWFPFGYFPANPCDSYAICGANSICNPIYTRICQCLQGFVPRSPENWNVGIYSDGCVRKISSSCLSENFLPMSGVMVPDTLNVTAERNKSLDECRDWCLRNCSCLAYAKLGATGCLTWLGDLLDLKVLAAAGNDLFVRLPFSESDSAADDSGKRKPILVIVITSVLGFLVSLGLLCLCIKKRNQIRGKVTKSYSSGNVDDLDLPLFDLHTIRSATNDFSVNNILGKGGFGHVYKGQLGDGQEIAVKRLSKSSTQGLKEFKNEVMLIVKLQHKNLVQLLGCCIEEEERMLIYEYMQHGSLDSFIFDRRKVSLLNWQNRLDIIRGIARGLLYLHQDSRLKIIHRDLKTSNILLDEALNPKISDFGMARILQVGQLDEHTRRVVGTYGYMAPEYAMDGLFSEKSDVFSFGVIVLQVLSGKRNRILTENEEHTNLLEFAWKLWKEGRCLELLEQEIESSYPVSQILRYIQIGLLCVQERNDDRPTMKDVVLMLTDESNKVGQPRRPGFSFHSTSTETSSFVASNEVTVTVLQGR